MVGKRGDGGVREEAVDVSDGLACCMMGRRMTRGRRSLSTPGRRSGSERRRRVKRRHTNGHAIALHFACQTLDDRGW